MIPTPENRQTINHFPRSRRGGVGAIFLVIIIAAAVIFGAYYASSVRGSRERTDDYYTDHIDGEKAMAYLKESEELESQFNSIHSVKKDKITSEDISIYEKAILSYEKYLTYSGIDRRTNPRADRMRRRLHDFRATKARERSEELENEADKLAGQKKYAQAEKKYREAAELEETIESRYSLSTKRSPARTLSLKNRMLTMQAIPLRDRAEVVEKKGDEALAVRDWDTASKQYREALKLRQRLWADYRIVVFEGTQSIAKLTSLIDTVDSAPYLERQEAAEAAAKKAEEAMDWDQAKAEWEKAIAEFDLIGKNYPKSQFADRKIRERLKQELSNAEAAPNFLELKGIVSEIQRAIIAEKTEDVPLLARRAVMTAARISENFPNNTLVTQDMRDVLAYIDVKSRDIPQIQKPFMQRLLPIPGVAPAERKMYAQEISQAFYVFVMGENPSADTSSMGAPVESVSFQDAQKFAERLSLICGYETRLPTLEEFEAAAGEFDKELLPEQAWTIENSSSHIHECATKKPNANGFFDLFGNVSEWVADIDPANPDSNERTVIGGDCQSLIDMLAREHTQKTLSNDKSRLRGFRVVVDFTKPTNILNTKFVAGN